MADRPSPVQNSTKLSKIQAQAALEVARDLITDQGIADSLEIGRETLSRWKRLPLFQAAVRSHRDLWAKEIADLGLSDRRNRISYLHDRRERMQRVIEARAEAMAGEAPGTDTGLLVHLQKQIGGGRDATIVDEYQVDTGLLREMRETEKQAAQELGQWVERRSVTPETLDWARDYAKSQGLSEEEGERIARELAGVK